MTLPAARFARVRNSAWFALVLMVLVSLFTAAPEAEQRSAGRAVPKLVISKVTHDLGSVGLQEPERIVPVTLRNTGSRPLEIRRIRTSCNCLKVDQTSLTIGPGKQTSVSLIFNPRRSDSIFVEKALIYSNDPDQPLTFVEVSGSLRAPIVVLPEAIGFPETLRSDLASLKLVPLRIASADGTPIGNIRVSSSIPAIHATPRKLEDGSYEVAVSLDRSIPIGRINESLTITTEHPVMPVIEVPVGGVIFGDLDPVGRRLDFGLLKQGQAGQVTFLLRNWGTKEIHVLRTEVQMSAAAEAQVTPEGRDFKIVLKAPPAPAFTRLVGYLLLHTDDPDQPVVRLQVGGGVLADHPFEAAAAGQGEAFFTIVKDALSRGDHIPADRFFSDVLGGVNDERAVDILLRALTEADLAERMRAAELLARFKTPRVLDALRLASTEDTEEFVRRNALVSYTEAVGKAAVPTLLLALQDDMAWVREDAANFLGKLGDAKVIPALRAALNDPDPDANLAIRTALIALQATVK